MLWESIQVVTFLSFNFSCLLYKTGTSIPSQPTLKTCELTSALVCSGVFGIGYRGRSGSWSATEMCLMLVRVIEEDRGQPWSRVYWGEPTTTWHLNHKTATDWSLRCVTRASCHRLDWFSFSVVFSWYSFMTETNWFKTRCGVLRLTPI